jgi:predicted amidophosphoribosyltransferase
MDSGKHEHHIEAGMSPHINPAGYRRDPRGNRLEGWTTSTVRGGHVLWLRGPDEIARQVVDLVPAYQLLPRAITAGSWWTHALELAESEVRYPIHCLLDLLKEVITLPARPYLDFAIALDWYKIPEDGVDSRQWKNTAAGELIHAGKYRFRFDADRQRAAGLAAVGMMCDVIERHALLKHAAIVLTVPGHDSRRVSFGPRLAATIAMHRDLRMVKVKAKSQFRPEAKNLKAANRIQVLRDQFTVPDEIRGQPVLIVDDVFKTGSSMSEVARAARQSGAVRVCGICCVRTLSNR